MPAASAKCLRPTLARALSLLGIAAAVTTGDPPAAALETARDPDAPVYCVQAWPEARYRNYGYDHIVHMYNGCRARADCRVATNVAPKPIRVVLAPGEKKEVLTFRGSPSSEFQVRASCELER